ncbi:class II fructose-bisphosphatase [Phenylobacterium aquaticum]|uniref:class II fructose-bisphosphatase n=1 Tax=Phenylobacterium aquaticum TaxID=1763816 RepID=UPI001F5E0E9C|nr:class II fructose-bisphosphatase [Phenylobacterium aquaticum]MCI3133074.1 class II fructose-bisphosphatase [Phenylobacterium aquaticum]
MSSEVLDRGLVMDAVRVTEIAAIAAWKLVGRGDEIAADQAAVDAMRTALNDLNIDGQIVIGEGERDEAPMLYIGEKVGKGKGPKIDIALDPLEGTTLTAKAMANALTVMAWAPKGSLLNAPDTYMDKIACGPGYPEGVIDLDKSPAENIQALAAAKGVEPTEITVCVLDRPRHTEIIAQVRAVGARVHLITDGDVAGVMNAADPTTGVDLYLGQGGAPEGVLACAALKCVGGQFQGRLVFRSHDEKARAARVGITDFDKKYNLHEMVRADAIFAATGVTNGALLDGVRLEGGFVHTHTLVMNSATRTVREVRMKRPV